MNASDADLQKDAAPQRGAATLPPGRHRPREHLHAFVDEIAKDAELMAQLRDGTGSGEKMRDAICTITTRVHGLDPDAGLWEGAQVAAILAESLGAR